MTLRTCPAGHSTCWPYACPVCRAAATLPQGRKGRIRRKLTHAEAVAVYWDRWWAKKAKADLEATRAKLKSMGLR